MTRQLTIGGTYRHYKGGLYTVLDTFTSSQHFRKGMRLLPDERYKTLTCASDIFRDEESVVYENGDGEQFLRDKANFLEVMGKPTSQYYRFQEVVA